MNLWKGLLLLLQQEPIYSLLLVLLGGVIIIVNKIKNKDSSKSLFTVFLYCVIIPLVSVRAISSHYNIKEEIKPIFYIALSLGANDIVEFLGSILKALGKLVLQKENLNKFLSFIIDFLLRIKVKDVEKDGQNDNSSNTPT